MLKESESNLDLKIDLFHTSQSMTMVHQAKDLCKTTI